MHLPLWCEWEVPIVRAGGAQPPLVRLRPSSLPRDEARGSDELSLVIGEAGDK